MYNQGYTANSAPVSALRCPNCRSNNVQVQYVQKSASTRTKGKGILYKLARAFMIFFTLGLWALFGKKAAKSKTKYENEKTAICQQCGKSWAIE